MKTQTDSKRYAVQSWDRGIFGTVARYGNLEDARKRAKREFEGKVYDLASGMIITDDMTEQVVRYSVPPTSRML